MAFKIQKPYNLSCWVDIYAFKQALIKLLIFQKFFKKNDQTKLKLGLFIVPYREDDTRGMEKAELKKNKQTKQNSITK